MQGPAGGPCDRSVPSSVRCIAGEHDLYPCPGMSVLHGPDGPSMSIGDRLDDGEPEPRPPFPAATRCPDAVEALKHALTLGGRDAGPVVDHGEAHAVARGRLSLEADEA